MTSRIRIDNDAAEKLKKAANIIDGSKTGLASEILRDGAEEIIEDHQH